MFKFLVDALQKKVYLLFKFTTTATCHSNWGEVSKCGAEE